jgi:uncharacterized membrane protein
MNATALSLSTFSIIPKLTPLTYRINCHSSASYICLIEILSNNNEYSPAITIYFGEISMNEAHLHLVLVHIPIVIAPTATLLMAIALWRKNQPLLQTALIGMTVCTLFAITSHLTGEGSEELVEPIRDIVESRIEEHESAAILALWMSIIMGISSLTSLITLQRGLKLSKRLVTIILVLGIATSAALAYTGLQGGKIRHPEAFSEYNTAGNPTSRSATENDDD